MLSGLVPCHSAPGANSTYTVADAFLQALAEAQVDYLFTVLGSDHPSIVEAYWRRQSDGKLWPKMLHFQHEFAAISAADGYARITCRAQCVIVHTDVGTAALGQGLHNASSGRSPMLIFAGLAPYTIHGELGSRSEHVQWFQDVPNQSAIVAPYVRYSNEIRSPRHVKAMVHRALLMASTGSAGPSYLTATREVLALPVPATPAGEDIVNSMARVPSCIIGGLPAGAVRVVSEALFNAREPLIVTGYLGRNHGAIQELLRLANLLPDLSVLDTEFREMSFPTDHTSWITPTLDDPKLTERAQMILVLDCDVPWIPSKAHPNTVARIFHIDIDVRKEHIQSFDINTESSFLAECAIALQQVCGYIENHMDITRRPPIDKAKLIARANMRARLLQEVSRPLDDGKISSRHLVYTLRELLPLDTTYVHDAVTNATILHETLRFTALGTNFSKGGSGLGWAGGAAIGVKLALDKYDVTCRPQMKERPPQDIPDKFVCAITGDGAFVFGAPTATYFAQHRLNTPFLTVVINNGGWKATRKSFNDVHPEGIAAGLSDEVIGIDLSQDRPDYVGVAVAASNGSMWGKRVVWGPDLRRAVIEARDFVLTERRGAILEVVVVK